MMHRCAVGGSCSYCHGGGGGIFAASHHSPSPNSPSFSFLFSSPKQPVPSLDDPFDLYQLHGNPYSSPVDCTLSLGTPSTRSSSGYEAERRSSAACMPNFCRDLFQPPNQYSSSAANVNGNCTGYVSGNDTLITRRCANCDTTSTPLWRNGPQGPKSLCNACGIRFKKEERRAAAGTGHPPLNSHGSWGHARAASQSHKKASSCFSVAAISKELQFADEDGGGAGHDSEISFLSWRLNVADRPGLVVHDFTR